MNIKFISTVFLILTSLTLGQTTPPYPLVTLQDINAFGDTASKWWPSPLAGDTVRVRGTVLCRPLMDPVKNRTSILYYAAAIGCYIESPDRSPWGGLEIYQADSTAYATGFDFCDTAVTYEFTGLVSQYGAVTELALITSPVPIPVKLISHQSKRPDPIRLTLDSCFNSDGSFNLKLRKYNGMYVEFVGTPDLITSDLTTGSFSIDNGYIGKKIKVFMQSRYYRPGYNYIPPPNGTYLTSIRGILEGYQPGTGYVWEIAPLYPGDIISNTPWAPYIAAVKRSPSIVGPNDSVIVTCSIGKGGIIAGAALYQRINGGPINYYAMYKVPFPFSDSIWTATIPKTNDSALVDFYIKAWDGNHYSISSPADTNFRYTYLVLNRPLTIQDVRYSPFGSALSSYDGYKVKISGVVISDTSDIPGNHVTNSPRVYIQNGSTPWSGILLGSSGPIGSQVLNLKRGDNVTVEGIVVFNSSFSGTRIDSLSSITVNSHNNPLPVPHVIRTGDVGNSHLGALSSEPWNGSLVTYSNITIDSANADGSANYGESFCHDSLSEIDTRIVWSDGNTKFNAGPSAVKVHIGDKFTSITGILGFTNSQYKLCPRKDDDISGYISEVKNEKIILPIKYALYQNYPNPFNPTTTITYSLPIAGNVKLTIYNPLGSKVATIVNEYKTAGNYSAQFNASNLASGIYFYRLESGQFSQIKKMILIK